MEFKELVAAQQRHIQEMVKDAKLLYVTDVNKDKQWELYLSSFPAGTNKKFRERDEYDCNSCKSFIRSFGGVVAIDPQKGITTAWDFTVNDSTYAPVIAAMAKSVKAAKIVDILVTDTTKFGVAYNHEDVGSEIITWAHLHAVLPQRFVFTPDVNFTTPGSYKGRMRDLRNVFQRGLKDITEDAIEIVLEMIATDSLYRGEEKANMLEKFKQVHATYHKIKTDKAKDLYCWHNLALLHPSVLDIRTDLLGLLLLELSAEDYDLEAAVGKYEAAAAPENYRRPKPVYNKRMLEAAQKTVEDLGLMNSLGRRFAVIDDITVNNVLFANKDVVKRVAKNPFQEMAKEDAINPQSFSRLETISAEKFISDVLPSSKDLEIFFENKHQSNLVSLIAPIDRTAPSIMRWNNNFGWAYAGNLADSSMKQAVAKAGGRVDGVLRCSIQWGDKNRDNNDLDLHCTTPNFIGEGDYSSRGHIWYQKREGHTCSGNLDVDIQYPLEDPRAVEGVAVENITWPDRDKMPEGEYTFFVNPYAHRGGKLGFRAEIEFDGNIFQYDYDKDVKQDIEIAVVRYTRAHGFEIVRSLGGSMSSRSTEIWGIKTNVFHPVSICAYSPNFWDGQEEVGNRHYMFMIRGCVHDGSPNGFFNEFLRPEFTKHRKVFEALGGKMRVEPSENQLSGLGFSTTKRAELVVRSTGHLKRMFKVAF